MMINNSISIPAFEELFETTAVQEVIDVYVNKQVEKVRIEKDKEIQLLNEQLEATKLEQAKANAEMVNLMVSMTTPTV